MSLSKAILERVASGEITVEQALEMDTVSKDRVSILANGRLRLQNGTQVDVTIAQLLLVRDKADEIDDLLMSKLSGTVECEHKSTSFKDKKSGETKTREWDEYRMGGVLLGYKRKQVDHVLKTFAIEEAKVAPNASKVVEGIERAQSAAV